MADPVDFRSPRQLVEEMPLEELADILHHRLTSGPAISGWTPSLVSLHELWRPRGLQVVPEHFYSPVFDPGALPEDVWSGRFDAGAVYDADAQIARWREVNRFGEELAAFPEDPEGPHDETTRFFWKNAEFSHQDAMLYYSLLRHLDPARVIEIGGGFSTLLAAEAAAKNGSTRIDCIEPYPRPFLSRGIPGVRLDPRPVQEVPLELYRELAANDVLFVDCSHVAKTGSDVNHILLRIVPRLAAGVWVHVHDIFLPFEYPRDWPQQRLYFSEQYVLAALLANSRALEVMIGVHFLLRVTPERIRLFRVPGRKVLHGGASFWMRTR